MRVPVVGLLLGLLAVPLSGGERPAGPVHLSFVGAFGQGLPDFETSLVALDTGRTVRLRSNHFGVVDAALENGEYAIDVAGSGYTVQGGPRILSIARGQSVQAVVRMEPEAAAQAAVFGDRDSGYGTRENGRDSLTDAWRSWRPSPCRPWYRHPCPISPSH